MVAQLSNGIINKFEVIRINIFAAKSRKKKILHVLKALRQKSYQE